MSSATHCIYCGNPTGSKEHIFPASMGGRVTYKRVICSACNNHFSELDTAFSAQLDFINGQIGTESVNSKKQISAVFQNVDGTEFTVDSFGKTSLTSATITSSRQSDGKDLICIKGSNQKQIDDCLNRLKSEGRKVTATNKRIVTNYMPTTYHTFSIGGECFLREVGRIVLNYTALKWPDIARKSELLAFKNSVFGNLKDCDDISYYVSLTADNPFRVDCDHSEFCHYIAIIRDHVNSCIYGRVILFGVLDFSVWLGECDFDISDNVLYIINPLQKKAAPPLCKSLDPSILPGSITRLELFANEVDVPNLMKNQFSEMFKRIAFFHFKNNYSLQINRIYDLPVVNKRSVENRLQHFIMEHQELIYNLLRQYKQDVIQEISHSSNPNELLDNKAISLILDKLICEDTERDSGLSDKTEGIICVIASNFSRAICQGHGNDVITVQIMYEWFRSNKGLKVVSDTFELLLSRL